jgi:hypothetical protein
LKCDILNFDAEGRGDHTGDLVLDGENILHLTVVAVGPQMHPGCPIDQLGGDSHPPRGAPNAAFDHIAGIKLGAEFGQVDPASLELKGGCAANDHEIAKAGKVGNDVLGQAIGEILVDPGAQVVEGEYRQDRLFRPGRPCVRRARNLTL